MKIFQFLNVSKMFVYWMMVSSTSLSLTAQLNLSSRIWSRNANGLHMSSSDHSNIASCIVSDTEFTQKASYWNKKLVTGILDIDELSR